MSKQNMNRFDRSTSTQDERFIVSIQKRVARTIYVNNQLQDGDKILIPLSGGKDSLALTELLSGRKKSLPFSVALEAVHIALPQVGYQADQQYLADFCRSNGVPLILLNPSFDLQKDSHKSICYRCSALRRKAIFTLAQRSGFTKIAFGHHRDDALETLLMNMVYHGSVSSIPYRFQMRDYPCVMVRPLLDLTEQDLSRYSSVRGFKGELSPCPYKDTSQRSAMKQVLTDLEKMDKKAKINLFRAMGNICQDYLPHQQPPGKHPA